MKRAIGAVLLLAAVLVQVTWAPRLEVAGAFPNLALIAVIGTTWTFGARAGLAWACFAGLLLDLTAAGPLGPHAIALLAAAYTTGFWARNFQGGGPVYPALAAVAGTALYSLILVGADDALGLPVPPPAAIVQLILAASGYNALLMPVGLVVLRRLRSPGVGGRVEAV
jgi:rod shape-determining protein MreD